MDQEFGHRLAGSSAQGFTKLKSKPSSLLKPDIHFSALVVVGRIQFIVVVGLRTSFFGWLLAEACSHLLEGCLHRPSQSMKTYFFKANRRIHHSSVKTRVLYHGAPSQECLFLHLCHILVASSSYKFYSHFRGRHYTRVWPTEDNLRVCLLQWAKQIPYWEPSWRK